MKSPATGIALAACLLCAATSIHALTIEIATAGTDYIQVGDIWRYKKGDGPPSDPVSAWTEAGFDDSTWLEGPSGFGYADGDDATILGDMAGNYLAVYIRKEFVLDALPPDELLQLVVDYDDGFVAYLNAAEVARESMPAGTVTFETEADPSHEAGTPETCPLGRAADLLHVGTNVLAIEVHNSGIDSTDLSMIPALATTSDVVRDGETWIVGSEVVPLRGTVSSALATSVKIDGETASFDSGARTFSGDVALLPGTNVVTVEALDAALAVVESGAITILYVPPSNQMGGHLTEDATWAGAVVVDQTVIVDAGVTLTIEAGTSVLFKTGMSLRVEGRLLADGTEDDPIRLTHYGDGNTWERILLLGAEDSRLAHCVVEYADSEGAHQDYYAEGSRDYHEAIVALACHVDIESCIFQHLPDQSAGAEGDAIAIISDDPDLPGEATANVRGCQFLEIGQGVHTRYSPIVVEDCFFTGKRGDNDDVDLWGESDPPPLVINNVFIDPGHDDMINPTRCSAVIIGNYVSGSDDHGIVLRDAGFPIVMNNVITNCSAAG
ncbi:MAG: right-handed parallel beta-helix repeat-containing protein, partial [Planctomycetes bacterium]|nr:right-handed parallel beta-helix repeat-containing protein [Planctomycetota bacterium]